MQAFLKLTGLVFMCAALVFTPGCSKERKQRNHLAKAESLIAKEQFQRAEIELINAIRIPPENATAYHRLGVVYQAQGRWLDAYRCFRQADRLTPGNPDYQVALGNIEIHLGMHPLARSNVFHRALVALKQAPTNTEAMLLLSQSVYTTNSANEALNILGASPAGIRESAAYHTARGNTLLRLVRLGEALQEFQTALKIDTNLVAAYEGAAEFELMRGNANAAGSAYRRASELAPHRSRSRLSFANFVIRLGATNSVHLARPAIEETSSKAPDFVPAWLTLARLNRLERKYTEAAANLQKALAIEPNHQEALLLRATLHLDQGNLTNALAQLQKAASAYPKDPEVLLALARIQLQADQISDASATVARVLSIQTNNIAGLLLHAQITARSGNDAQALPALLSVTSLAPKLAEPRFLLASVYARQGQAQKAMEQWSFIRSNLPATRPVLLSLATNQAQSGFTNDAAATFLEVAELEPTNAAVQISVAQQLIYCGRLSDSRRLLQRLLDTTTNSLMAQSALADIDVFEKKWDSAKQRLNAELQKTAEPGLWVQLGQTHIQHANNLFAESPEWKRFRASPSTVAKPSITNVAPALVQLRAAETALRKGLELNPELKKAAVLLKNLYEATGRTEESMELVNDLLADENTAAGQEAKALLFERRKQYKEAAAAYEAALKLDPNLYVSLNNLAAIYTEYLPNRDQALSLAERAYKLAPAMPHIQDTLGWLLVLRGDYRRGRDLLLQATQNNRGEPDVLFHLGAAHYFLGAEESAVNNLTAALDAAKNPNKQFSKKAEAARYLEILKFDPAKAGPQVRAVLEQCWADNPRDIVAMSRLAALDEQANAPEAALQKYEKAIAQNPDYWPALFGAARLHLNHEGDHKKALDLATRARTLNPSDPAIAHLLGVLAFKTGDHRGAETLLSEAANSPALAGNPQVSYDLAWAAYSMGRIEAAERAMALAAQDQAFDKQRQAQAFLAAAGAVSDRTRAAQFVPEARKLVADNPAHLPALMVIALASEAKPAPKEAAESYSAILVKYPRFAPAARNLAILSLLDLQDPRNALALANKAREGYPEDASLAAVAEIARHRLKQRVDVTALERAINRGLPQGLEQEANRVIKELRQPPRKS